MNKLIIALAASAAGLSLFAGNLPLIQDGLVVHLDAADVSTMTMDGDGQIVTEWRSKVGDVKYGLREGQDVETAPYYQASATCGQIPALVFGFPPDYAYTATTADGAHMIQTYLTADRATTNRTVIMVVQSLNYKTDDNHNGVLFGGDGAGVYGISYMGSYSRASIAANSSSLFGDTGYAWVNGVLKYDLANDVYETYPTHAASTYRRFAFSTTTVGGPAIHVLVGQARTDADMFFTSGLGRSGANATYCPMLVSEVVVYDRDLTETERLYTEDALERKWKTKVFSVCWTGRAGDNAWETAENWEGNAVPAVDARVVIDRPTAVTISGTAEVAEVVLGAGASVTVNEGAALACAKVVPTAGNALVVNGLLDYKVAGGTVVTPMAITVAGNGIIGKRGRGTLVWPAGMAMAPTLALRVDDGLVDLNGASLGFRSVFGGGTVSNSSDVPATLEIVSDAACALEAKVTGNVSLKKSGTGELSHASGQDYAGATVLAGGTMKAVTNIAIQTLPGLEVHLDASRADTLTLREGDNAVLEWRSLTGDGLAYRPPRDFTEHMYFKEGGKYDGDCFYEPTGIGGKLPCVQFGEIVSARVTRFGALVAAGYRETTNRTVIIVQQNIVSYSDTLTAFGNYQGQYYPSTGRDRGMIEFDSQSGGRYKHSIWNGKLNDVYFNARQVWSREAYESGTQEAEWFWGGTSNVDRPSVLSVVVPDDNEWTEVYGSTTYRLDTFKTAVGSGRVYHDGLNENSGMRQYCGRVCELLVFGRALPDAERRMIETYLMEKWINGIQKSPYNPGERAFTNTLSSSTFVVTADTTFAPIGSQAIAALTVDAQGAETAPCLTLTGDLDLSQTAFILTNGEAAVKGPVVQTTGTLSGEFKSVEGVDAYHKLVYRAKDVIYKAIRGVMLLVR